MSLGIFDGQACYFFNVESVEQTVVSIIFASNAISTVWARYVQSGHWVFRTPQRSWSGATRFLLWKVNWSSQHRLDQVYNYRIYWQRRKSNFYVCSWRVSHSKLVKKLRGESESLIMGCHLNERTPLLQVNHMDTIVK